MTPLLSTFGSASVRGFGLISKKRGPSGGVSYKTAGSYTFTVPADVYSISAVAIGSGGKSGPGGGESGGGGAGLGWVSGIAVTPGQTISVTVPPRRDGGTPGSAGEPGIFGSYINAGGGGQSYPNAGPGGEGGVASVYGGTTRYGLVGGRGGRGFADGRDGGCGGTSGYTNTGGGNGGGSDQPRLDGAGGGGAGGDHEPGNPIAGGTGIYGVGADGIGAGVSGSGGLDSERFGVGGTYWQYAGGGAVRVIWGDGLSYPYNAPLQPNEIII